MFQIVRSSQKPLGDQVVEEVVRLIETGRLTETARLPSVRGLARRVGVSVYTIATAFERLQALGLIESRPGSGHFVARQQLRSPAPAVEGGLPPSGDPVLGFARSALDPRHISVPAGAGFLPPDWLIGPMSPAALAKFARSGAASMPAPAPGDADLRELLAQRLHRSGVAAAADNLLVTFGASHAFNLIARRLLSPGDTVLVDDPGYSVLLRLLKAHRLNLVPVPKHAEGTDPQVLEDMARIHRPRMFFTQTLIHNPTGITATPGNCHEVLSIAERYGFLIAEDHVYSDFGSPHLVSLAQIDGLRRVLYVGSFTKTLTPGIRVGYIAAAEPLIPQLIEEKLLSVLSGSALDEFVVREILASGKYRRHIERLRVKLAHACAVSTAKLASIGLELQNPAQGGCFLWAAMPGVCDTDRLAAEARAVGILLAPGSMFSLTDRYKRYLRFNAAYASDPALMEFLSERCRVAA